jgi:glycosyltransferase involved in cell wall biosynthesis
LRFLTLFPEAENVHLTKDVGMIPFALHKEHHYESTLACYENGAYPYLDSDVAGLKLIFIRRIFNNRFLDGLWFLCRNGKHFDAMQTYHLRFSSLFWLFAFKLLSKKHTTYLKLDAHDRMLAYNFQGLPAKVNKMLLRSADLISAETKQVQEQLSGKWKRRILLVPNGFYTPGPLVQYQDKKQIILTTGRIGAPEKRHDVLLEAFAGFSAGFPAWTLQLTGPVEQHFENYIESYFKRYPHLRERIQFTGAIEDRKLLFEQYAAAKIFCLSSDREGFPLSLVEAASAGCYLVCSSFVSASDSTNDEQYGTIFPMGNKEELSAIFRHLATDESIIENNVLPVQEYAKRQFSWKVIAGIVAAGLRKY